MAEGKPAPKGDRAGLKRETGWWGAFVIGLSGTILVTGIAPVMVTGLGAASVPIFVVFTFVGLLLCLFLAELAAMMPERTGGLPSYASAGFQTRWPRLARHVNGASAWMYWLGWFPVAPLNMLLASSYLMAKVGLVNPDAGEIDPRVSYWLLGFSVLGTLCLCALAWRGIRLGVGFATVLGILSMIPLLILALAVFVSPSTRWDELSGFCRRDGSGFFAPDPDGRDWLTLYLAWAFPLTWSVFAMEAAACYIGECKNPARDAKISLAAEGVFGLFIYGMVPLSLVAVLGAATLQEAKFSHVTLGPMYTFGAYVAKLSETGNVALDWAITLVLVVALVLSALNGVMGCARSLYQMAVDGQFPRIFAHVNRHGVPGFAMIFGVGCSVVCSVVAVFFGGLVAIWTFSNVGYLGSIVPVLVGYYLLRKDRPDLPRPVRLPSFMKYVALLLAALCFAVWSYGGYQYAAMFELKTFYFVGWGLAFSYLFFYAYRVYVEDRRPVRAAAPPAVAAEGPAGDPEPA